MRAALRKMGLEAVPSLIDALRDADFHVKYWSTKMLSEIGQDAVPALIEALMDKVVNVRYWSAQAQRLDRPEGQIGRAGPHQVPQGRALECPVRECPGAGFLWPGRQDAVPALSEAHKDEVWQVRTAAEQALQTIQGK